MVVIDGRNFRIVDCGGGGDCLFKCLAKELVRSCHEQIRHEIVNFITINWNNVKDDSTKVKFKELVENVLEIRNRRHYSEYMKRGGTFATEVECIAATYVYNVNIIIVKEFEKDKQFIVPLRTDDLVFAQTIYLLFSGETENGHFQVLRESTSFNEININNFNNHNNVMDVELNTDCIDRLNCENSEVSVLLNNDNHHNIINCEQNVSGSEILDTDSDISIDSEDSVERQPFSKNVKKIICRVRYFFQKEKNQKAPINVQHVVLRTAECLKISERSVKRITCAEKKSGGEVYDPLSFNAGRKPIVFNEHLQGIVRRFVFNMYLNKEYPTVSKVLNELKINVPEFPDISDFTLRKLLRNMNFRYRKLQNRSVLMESSAISGKRAEYLRMIDYYRKNDYNIFYTDETWCGANHHLQYGWVEKIIEKDRSSFDHYRSGVQEVNGYKGGFVCPSGSGKRVIILHIGSKDGFLDGCLKCFIGKKGTSDYHDEMNAAHFEEWFRDVLNKLPSKSIVVIDQAPYHTMLDPEKRNPTSSYRKQAIIDWLIKRNVPVPSGANSFEELSKVNLLHISKEHRYPKSYLLEKITKEMRGDEVKLLWLPVAHCEFNAIEFIWAYVKKQVASNNKTFKINDVHEMCINIMNSLPPTLWENSVRHVEDLEKSYRLVENQFEREIDPLIIELNEDNSSDEYTDSDSM